MSNVTEILNEINKNEACKRTICLNQKQTAEIIGVSQSTLENWRNHGFGPRYIKNNKIGKKSRVLYPKINIAIWVSKTIKTA